jgi:Lrp/AsnC family transcriptional regulator
MRLPLRDSDREHIHRILSRSDCFQGRVASREQIQVQIGFPQHREWVEQFRRAVDAIPEIVEAYRMSGEIDYLLRVVVPDIAGYDAVYKRLIERIELADVTSSFSMEEMKHTTALPLDYA